MVYIYRYIYALVLIFAVSAWAHAQEGSVQQKGYRDIHRDIGAIPATR